MAIDRGLADDLAKLVNLGDTISYTERNNKQDSKTFTDERNLFEKALKNKDILELLTAIYDMTKTSRKINGQPFAISMNKNKYIVTSIKDAKTVELEIILTPTLFKVYDKLTKKTTRVELGQIIDRKKAEVEPLKKQLETALKTVNSDADIVELMQNLLNNKWFIIR